MDRLHTSINIHIDGPECNFDPSVRSFDCLGKEIIALDLEFPYITVFLSRERLHLLTNVLIAACAEYPAEKPIEPICEVCHDCAVQAVVNGTSVCKGCFYAITEETQ